MSDICYKDTLLPEALPGLDGGLYALLKEALTCQKVIWISYRDGAGVLTEREILPEVLYRYCDNWYLEAFCYLRNEERAFRVDRIDDIRMTERREESHDVAQKFKENGIPWLYEDDEFSFGESDRERLEPVQRDRELDFKLLNCAERGDLSGLKEALAQGGDINFYRRGHETPLMAAAENGHWDMVVFLLDHGADPYLKNEKSETVLFAAVKARKYKVVRLLLTRCAWDLNDRDIHGWTLLMTALVKGDLLLMELLLEQGAPINTVDKKGRSALMLLLQSFLSSERKSTLVFYLLNKGADMTLKDKRKRHVLFYAVEDGNTALLKYFLEKGSLDVNARDSRGKTPFFAALEGFGKKHEPADLEQLKEMCLLLLTHGADIDLSDEKGVTPLMLAPSGVWAFFAEHKADFFAKDCGGGDLLMRIKPRCEEVVLLIEKYGFSINDRNDEESLLHRAANALQDDTVQYLLEKGADPFVRNGAGRTPLEEFEKRHPYAMFETVCCDGVIYSWLEAFQNRDMVHFAAACRRLDIEKLRSFSGKVLKGCIEDTMQVYLLNPLDLIEESAMRETSDPLLEEIFDLLIDHGYDPFDFAAEDGRNLMTFFLERGNTRLAEKYLFFWWKPHGFRKEVLQGLYEEYLGCPGSPAVPFLKKFLDAEGL